MISVINLFGLALGAVYASLLVFAGITQLGKNEFPDWTLKMLAFFGLGLDFFILLRYFGYIWSITLIIIGLIGVQAIAVYNGLYLYKRVDYGHQSIRVVLSLSIIFLVLI